MNKKRVVIGVLSFSLITLIILSLVLAVDPNPGVFGHNSRNIDFSSGISNAGNIGIGTTNPSYKLVISDPNSKVPSTMEGTGLAFGEASNYKWIQSYNSNPLVLNPIGNNIGIGTTNPSEKLEVVGNIKASGSITIGQLCFTGGGCIS